MGQPGHRWLSDVLPVPAAVTGMTGHAVDFAGKLVRLMPERVVQQRIPTFVSRRLRMR
jgi:hypothetical protein